MNKSRTLVGVPLALAAGLGSVAAGFQAAPAHAATTTKVISKSVCQGFNTGTHGTGECLQYQAGGTTHYLWVGTYLDAHGKPFICLDWEYDGHLNSFTTSSIAGAGNQFGKKIDAATLQSLSYALSKYAPSGQSSNAVVDAALSAIAREVMGDTGGVLPTLTAATGFKDATWHLPANVEKEAATIWSDAVAHHGVPRLTTTGLPKQIEKGQLTPVTFTLTSSATGKPLSGVSVQLSLTNAGTPGSLRQTTNAKGQVTFQVHTMGNPSTISVSAKAVGIPGTYANIAVPSGWKTNAQGGKVVQRGLIATSASATASTQAQVKVVPATYHPSITTQVSKQTGMPGDTITDTVQPVGIKTSLNGQPVQNTLTGVILAASPKNGACDTVDWSHAKQVGSIPATPVTSNAKMTGVGRYTIPKTAAMQCTSYRELITATQGGKTIATFTSQAGQKSETTLSKPAVKMVTESYQVDTATITGSRGAANLYLSADDDRKLTFHELRALWHSSAYRGHFAEQHQDVTISVPADATAAQRMAAINKASRIGHVTTTAIAGPTSASNLHITYAWKIDTAHGAKASLSDAAWGANHDLAQTFFARS